MEGNILGNADAHAPFLIFSPTLRQVQAPGQGLAAGGTSLMQAHRDLAVGQFAERTAVLVLHAGGVSALLGKLVSSMIQKASPFCWRAAAASRSHTGSQSQGLWLTNCC